MLLILWLEAVVLGVLLSTTGVIYHEKAQTEPGRFQSEVSQGHQDSQTQSGVADARRDQAVDAVLQPGQCLENEKRVGGIPSGQERL
ncbi:MAG: hypothetical protein [Microvirus sp.]|nr:MAG: hypothetical protein [Microvirus sp.]